MEIEEGSLVILMGAPASGKSTLANRLFQPHEILTTDLNRLLLTNDENNWEMGVQPFALLQGVGEFRLAQHLTTVVDSTGAANVIEWAERMRTKYGLKVVGIVLDTDPELGVRRNRQRARQVPDDVIRSFSKQIHAEAARLSETGFFDGEVVLTDDAAIAALQIVRTPDPQPEKAIPAERLTLDVTVGELHRPDRSLG